MTLLLCISIPGPDLASIREQMDQALLYANMVELRIDLFDQISISELIVLKRQYPLPILVTLKSTKQGGLFSAGEAARTLALRHLCALQPELIDIELGTPKSEVLEIKRLLPHTHIVVSFHDPGKMPEDLSQVLYEMQQLPAHYFKIAVTAHSLLDSLRMVAFVRDVNRLGGNLCGICMGKAGQITRILAPVMGAPMTFASLGEAYATAPGQVPAEVLRSTYQHQRLNYETKMLGLIGDPVESSRSHLIHNAVFAELGLQAVYVKMRVQAHELPEFFYEARRLGWKGLSVTMPLKESVMPYLDVVDPIARAIGAVNTVVLEERGFVGYNFDGVGAVQAIAKHLSNDLTDKQFVVLGAGGAARAIAYEAKQCGAKVTLINRSAYRAEMLAEQLGVSAAPFERLAEVLRSAPDVVAHTTSVGMIPHVEASLVSPEDLQPHTLVFDAIGNPVQTRLIIDAAGRGCTTVSGREMWIGQAQQQILHWFGAQVSGAPVLDILQKMSLRF